MTRFPALLATVLVAATIPGATVSAQRTSGTAVRAARVPVRGVPTRVLPGTSDAAFATIQGNSLTATNGPLPNAIVRLRDVRYGRMVESQITDHAGLFAFSRVDPGNYIVELLEAEQRVVATSDLVSVNAGDSASTLVRLPLRLSATGRLGAASSQLLGVLSAAAASGVLAVKPTGEDISPR